VKRAYQSFGFGYSLDILWIWIFFGVCGLDILCNVWGSSFTLLVDHRSQGFHSAWHVLVKRADGHALIEEARQVDLSDGKLRMKVPLLSRLCPPLHRHGQVYCKPVAAGGIAVPNRGVRGSNGGFRALNEKPPLARFHF
jgi:hypothetical protein